MDVELAELEVIARYSLVVRQPTADVADVVAALRADLARLEAAPSTGPTGRTRPTPGQRHPAAGAEAASPPTARKAPTARRRG